MIIITLAGKPLAKQRIKIGFGTAFTPERTVNYEGQLAAAAQAVMAGRPPLTGPLAVHLEIRLPVPPSWSKKKQLAARNGLLRPTARPDFDNFAKMCDALNHIVWVDDAQVCEFSFVKRYSDMPGATWTVIEAPIDLG